MAGRYGGEEFTLIMIGATFVDARERGERLRQMIRSAPCIWQGPDAQTIGINVTVSIGVAAL